MLFFFIGATGKSAQIGLHTWLPDAMEGPTPVSALIHAATMVTAGIFLIVRCSPLFEYAPTVLLIITISGAITAFMAASIGLVQNDLKRVIAYSTCSQLGYMMIACGTSGYSVSIFHLTNHAFFKALLFLSAGSIIHALSDEQDMRKMGGLLNLLPFTYSMMLIGSLSLMGFPFLTGFYSKDLILEWTFGHFSINSLFAYWLGSISAFFTAFYSLRVLSLTFLKKPSQSKIIFFYLHEVPFKMAFPLMFLSIFSIFLGYFLKDMFVGMGTDFWGNSILTLPQNTFLLEAEFLNPFLKLLPVFLSLSGGFCAYFLYNFFFKKIYFLKMSFMGQIIYNFLNRKWFFDKIYNYLLVHNILIWGYSKIYQNIDRGLVELLGPTGIWTLVYNKTNFFLFFYNKYILTIQRIKSLYLLNFLILISILILNILLLNSHHFLSYNDFNNSFISLIDTFNTVENFNFHGYSDILETNLQREIFKNFSLTNTPLGILLDMAKIFNISMFPLDQETCEFLYYFPSEAPYILNLKDILIYIPCYDNFGKDFYKGMGDLNEIAASKMVMTDDDWSGDGLGISFENAWDLFKD